MTSRAVLSIVEFVCAMVDRLILILRALAGQPDADGVAARDGVADASRLAPDYADALLLVTDCPQIELRPAQRAALERVGETLERLAADTDGEHASRNQGNRGRLESQAREALRILGEPAG